MPTDLRNRPPPPPPRAPAAATAAPQPRRPTQSHPHQPATAPFLVTSWPHRRVRAGVGACDEDSTGRGSLARCAPRFGRISGQLESFSSLVSVSLPTLTP